ncbi:MAG: secretin N-terminal domain-containing protein [Nitrospinaceae bacterium]|nr:secretin N-terminal domain-containing protein [Nitrospinaceae bacterium]MDP7051084.1 secretin N-terminal domain-containing protein [Verrucomicrobiota bacterium]
MSLSLIGAATLFAQEQETNTPARPQTGKPSTSATAEDPQLMLNFQDVPLQSVLEYMSEAAGFIILGDTKVHGDVTILSKQPLNREEAIDLLDTILNEKGYTAIRRGRILKIVEKDKALIEDIPVKSGADPVDIPKKDVMVTQIIPIRFGNAAQLIENISDLLPDYATISANDGSNAIILTDTQTNIHRIAEIVSALDTSISSISEIRVFPLVYADAKQLAEVVKGLFENRSSGSSRSSSSRSSGIAEMMRARFGGGSSSSRSSGSSGRSSRSSGSSAALAAASRVVAISEERTNSLVVSAPSDVIPTIEQLVKEMDRTIEDVTELQVFKLQYADAYETAEILTNLFSDKDEIENSRGGYRFGSWGRSSSSSSSSRSRSSSSRNSSERMLQQKRVVAIADPRTNSVIVSATAELMSQIALMVERLDENKAKQQKVFTYSLEHADVEGVSAILRSMFEQQNGNFNSTRNRSSRDQQNPLDNRRVSDPQSSSGFSSQRR